MRKLITWLFALIAIVLMANVAVQFAPSVTIWLLENNIPELIEAAKNPYFTLLWLGLLVLLYLHFDDVVRFIVTVSITRNEKYSDKEHLERIRRVEVDLKGKKLFFFLIVAFIEVPSLLSMALKLWS